MKKTTALLVSLFALIPTAYAKDLPSPNGQEQESQLVTATSPDQPGGQGVPQPIQNAPFPPETAPTALDNEQEILQKRLLDEPPSQPSEQFPRQTNYGANQTASPTPSNKNNKSAPAPTMTTAQAVEQMVAPLTPEELRKVSGLRDAVSRQIATPEVATVPRISSVIADLSPGASMPVVRVAAGRPTFIVFEDITGSPWPLATAPINAQDKNFYVGWFTGTPTLYIQPLVAYGNGDIGVMLKGLPVPINIVLANGEPASKSKSRTYDSRINIRIPRRGPLAPIHSITSVAKIGLYDQDLQSLLDGVPPAQATRLKTDNSRVSIWKMGEKMYIRTTLNTKTMFSKTLSSADGTHVFEMELSPFVTLLDGDNTLTVKVDF